MMTRPMTALDLLRVKAETGRQAAFNRVQSKHVDFLLCERGTFRSILAIELDDSSHQRSARQMRDAFVEEVLEVIGLPAVRFPATRTYDPREMRAVDPGDAPGLRSGKKTSFSRPAA
jgi:hypothetical protein